MDEFEYLQAMYRRLSDAQRFAADRRNKDTGQAWEDAAVMLRQSIRDYLSMRPDGVDSSAKGGNDGR